MFNKKSLYLIALLVLFVFLPLKTIKAEESLKVDVKVEYYYLDEPFSSSAATIIEDQEHGALINLIAPEEEDYDFVYWLINGTIRKNLKASTYIYVQKQTNAMAVYKPKGTISVLFIDSNGKFIDSAYFEQPQVVIPPNVDDYSKPGLTRVGFVGYNDESIEDAITDDTLFVLKYETESFGGKVVVNGEVVVEDTTLNEIVSLSGFAPESFLYWLDNNKQIVSDDPNYSFTMLGYTREFYTLSLGESKDNIVNMTCDLKLRENYQSFVGQFISRPLEFGFLIAYDEVEINSYYQEGVIVAIANAYNDKTNEYLMSFPTTIKNVRAYALYDDGFVLSDYQLYEEDYNIVTFDYNLDEYSTVYVKVKPSTKVIMPNVDYGDELQLEGWFIDLQMKVGFDFNTVITEDITLYAKWQELETYTIEYILYIVVPDDAIEFFPEIKSYTIMDEITLETPINRLSSVFVAWYEDEYFQSNPVYKIEKGTTGNKVFYAKWTAKIFSVQFIVDEEIFYQTNVEYAMTVDELPIPEKEGFMFIAWLDEDEMFFNEYTLITDDLVLNAFFIPVG